MFDLGGVVSFRLPINSPNLFIYGTMVLELILCESQKLNCILTADLIVCNHVSTYNVPPLASSKSDFSRCRVPRRDHPCLLSFLFTCRHTLGLFYCNHRTGEPRIRLKVCATTVVRLINGDCGDCRFVPDHLGSLVHVGDPQPP